MNNSIRFEDYRISHTEDHPHNFSRKSYEGESSQQPRVGEQFLLYRVEDGVPKRLNTSTIVELNELEDGQKWRVRTKSGSVYIIEKMNKESR